MGSELLVSRVSDSQLAVSLDIVILTVLEEILLLSSKRQYEGYTLTFCFACRFYVLMKCITNIVDLIQN